MKFRDFENFGIMSFGILTFRYFEISGFRMSGLRYRDSEFRDFIRIPAGEIKIFLPKKNVIKFFFFKGKFGKVFMHFFC